MNQSDPTTRFSDRVTAYTRYRPGYPDAAIDWMLNAAALRPQGRIADIGSGTGIFTRPLLERGYRVFAVEPNGPMREAAEQTFGGHAGFVSISGAAESTTLPDQSIDLVTAAQAFHWFQQDAARAEFARILRPGGQVALIWNDRVTAGDAFHVAYEALLKAHATDYERVNHQNLGESDFAKFFVGPCRWAEFDNAQRLDLDGMIGRVESSSYMPGPGHERHPAMIDALHTLFERYAADGIVRLRYRTTVRVGRAG